jgi:hypothetical protein
MQKIPMGDVIGLGSVDKFEPVSRGGKMDHAEEARGGPRFSDRYAAFLSLPVDHAAAFRSWP